ncbi:hypothetical protein Mapa_000527 [Marchantia paleacea]|nr:hypothetical protein Mapa_000527 [Marchantia paleacea]
MVKRSYVLSYFFLTPFQTCPQAAIDRKPYNTQDTGNKKLRDPLLNHNTSQKQAKFVGTLAFGERTCVGQDSTVKPVNLISLIHCCATRHIQFLTRQNFSSFFEKYLIDCETEKSEHTIQVKDECIRSLYIIIGRSDCA